MSASGEGLNIISLGVSCQTAMQIRYHASNSLITSLTNKKIESTYTFLAESSLPFDWRIITPQSLYEMTTMGLLFPKHMNKLTRTPGLAPHWLQGCYFWHDFDGLNEFNFSDLFEIAKQKYAHKASKLKNLKGRKIFVVSNTQNNLDAVTELTGLDFTFDLKAIRAIKKSINALFPGEASELIVVSSKDRISGDWSVWPATVFLLDRHTKGADDVMGDHAQWGEVFTHYFANTEVKRSVL